MFIGQYIQKLNEKGRTALPVKYRREIGENAIVARWYEGCLVIVGLGNWQSLIERLTGRSEIITAPVRDTDRFILGSAFDVRFDRQGRFVIPKLLRVYAGLKDEVVFVGLGNRVEVWDKDAWDKREKVVQETATELVEKLSEGK